MRIEVLFAEMDPPPRADWFTARCPGCGNIQNLGSAAQRQNGEQTEYDCDSCATPVVIVGPAPALAGYRMKDAVVHPPAGMWLRPPGRAALWFPPPDKPAES
jgi:ribosomal protein S27E